MVESEAHELPEETLLKAIMFGWRGFQPVIEAIEKMAKQAGKPAFKMPALAFDKETLKTQLKAQFSARIKAAYGEKDKQTRRSLMDIIHAEAAAQFIAAEGVTGPTKLDVGKMVKTLEADVVRGQILNEGIRIDGRDTKTVRPILAEAGVLPRVHGSSLFTRGETQALVVATLGTGQDEQIIDAITGEYRDRFMLHYNFPPSSVGETGRVGSPGRREIGHGNLARRAINPLLPSAETFPYTLRVVSEITESNGSSSMATTCGTSLALMDAGVPLARPVGGIAMGLIKEGDKFAVLSDILGDEDHLGDMDFKVAGTDKGITALQMDLKITSINEAILKQALEQARDGRMHILGQMAEGLDSARTDVSEFAPRITTIKINPEKIREVIGSGGKVIREIVESTGTKIDISDDGVVKIAAIAESAAQAAVARIMAIAAEPELNKIYDGKVVKIMEFGAFVNFMGARDGLVHISQISRERIRNVGDAVKEGDLVKVKVVGFDDRGKIKLSMKDVDQTTGQELSPAAPSNRDEEAAA
jgi:polyribonucleotide nucleotidyltransferase